jgi:hypothetical protein
MIARMIFETSNIPNNLGWEVATEKIATAR